MLKGKRVKPNMGSFKLPLSVTRRGKIFKGVTRVLGNLSRALHAIYGVLGVLAVKFIVLGINCKTLEHEKKSGK